MKVNNGNESDSIIICVLSDIHRFNTCFTILKS